MLGQNWLSMWKEKIPSLAHFIPKFSTDQKSKNEKATFKSSEENIGEYVYDFEIERVS